MKTRIHSGFTMIDVMAVAGLCSVMLAVSLPALQSARQSSRDTDCLNRLKQIGLALHNYHDTHRVLPPGWTSRRPDGIGHPSTGWHCQILPMLELAKLYNSLSNGSVYECDPSSLELLKSPVITFRCPADSLTDTNPFRGHWGTANFVGNFGPHPLPQWSDSEFWPGQSPSAAVSRRNTTGPAVYGMFGVNSSVRFRDVTDGLSNTLLVGERSVIGRGGLWPGPRSNAQSADVVADASYCSPMNRSEIGFSARHTGGTLYFLLGDGSVRPILESIDTQPPSTNNPKAMGLLQKLSCRNDDNPISPSEF